jgi:hypothetical protein
MKVKLLLSFDHELPLGSVYKSYAHALFTPTQRILEAANKEDVKVCLFTDILSYIFFKKHNITEFTEPYVKQLQEAVRNGHDVQLHLHPHWLNSKYEHGRFIPSSNFALADFAKKNFPENIEGIIEQGIAELNTICRAVQFDYQCIAFRAGGFNLYPETSRILNALYENGIRIDSSIPKGLYFRSALSLINYKDMPSQCNWYIPLQGPLSAMTNTGLFEIPIATTPAGLWTNLKHLYFKRKNNRHAYNSGNTIHSDNVSKLDKLRFVFSVRMLGFDTYSLDVDDLVKMLKYNINKYQKEKIIILSTISHPKNMGPHAVDIMTGFIRTARKQYPDLLFVIHGEVLPLINT